MVNKDLTTNKQYIIDLFKKKKFSKISKISKKIRDYYKNQPDIAKIIIMSDLNTKNFIKAELFLRSILTVNNTSEFNYILGNALKAQDKNSTTGKILLINKNSPNYEVVSLGHRNPQGLMIDGENILSS